MQREARVPSRGVTVGEPKGADARGGEPACAGVDGVTAAAGVARSPHNSGGRDHPAGAPLEAPPLEGATPLGE